MDDIRRLDTLALLAIEPMLPVGTRVFVAEDGITYISTGNTRPEIAGRLDWTGHNVWLPEHVERGLHRDHPEIRRPIDALAYVLTNTLSVTVDARQPTYVRFILDAAAMRQAGFVTSRTMRWIDALVELRQVNGERLLRAIHLAPRRHPARGHQLWP